MEMGTGMGMGMGVLYLQHCAQTLHLPTTFPNQACLGVLTMPPGKSGRLWVQKMQVDDLVAHWKTGREGFVRYIAGDLKYMVIYFDEDQGGPCEEWRRCAAFKVKSEALPISIGLAIAV